MIPVAIMSASGTIAAVHTPLIAWGILAVNRRLPRGLRPGAVQTGLLGLAGLFYTLFAVVYFVDLVLGT